MKQTTQESLIDYMRESRERMPVSYVRQFPDLADVPKPCFVGHYSMTIENTKRYLKTQSGLVAVAPGLRESPNRIARDYLRVEKFKPAKPRRGYEIVAQRFEQYKSQPNQRKHINALPRYAKPCRFDNGYYIDIKSAYFQFMHVIGWDAAYIPGQTLFSGRPPDSFPFPDHKIARNCLVSAAQMTELSKYYPPDTLPKVMAFYNPNLNPCLIVAIYDILHAIAAAAVRCGAVYTHTDGYIAPDEPSMRAISQMLLDWGIQHRIEEQGAGGIKGDGCYKVGNREALDYRRERRTEQAFNGIEETPAAKWLALSYEMLAIRHTPYKEK
jgi:hypothetical protein